MKKNQMKILEPRSTVTKGKIHERAEERTGLLEDRSVKITEAENREKYNEEKHRESCKNDSVSGTSLRRWERETRRTLPKTSGRCHKSIASSSPHIQDARWGIHAETHKLTRRCTNAENQTQRKS